ncbi:hypothetical protein DFH06DRAFT_1135348 [Mycena polygramma]|nr:hypothetical protein DFH06DRAFT_1135348 [Mycena polygramma]
MSLFPGKQVGRLTPSQAFQTPSAYPTRSQPLTAVYDDKMQHDGTDEGCCSDHAEDDEHHPYRTTGSFTLTPTSLECMTVRRSKSEGAKGTETASRGKSNPGRHPLARTKAAKKTRETATRYLDSVSASERPLRVIPKFDPSADPSSSIRKFRSDGMEAEWFKHFPLTAHIGCEEPTEGKQPRKDGTKPTRRGTNTTSPGPKGEVVGH